jgi:hypothetical protein
MYVIPRMYIYIYIYIYMRDNSHFLGASEKLHEHCYMLFCVKMLSSVYKGKVAQEPRL